MVFEVISQSEFGSSIFSGEGEGAEVLKCNFHSQAPLNSPATAVLTLSCQIV